ncbi:hypothetical protein C8Q80DRAFT_1350043 [Daedaleopsis nitida]|nr:hypothetical protein C8Q80DRAFT_1350043 [Daedaleopsis nitida]
MFSRLATITSIVSLAVLAAAIPTGGPAASTCSTGQVQCCNSVEKASYWYEHGGEGLLGLLGGMLGDMDALLGLGCSPFLLGGGGSGECHASTVCCEDNSHVRHHFSLSSSGPRY